MISIEELTNNPEIERLLTKDQHSADVYALHTGDEAMCSAYFVELVAEPPQTALEKYLTLWKAYSIRTYLEAGASKQLSKTYLPKLLEEFGYVQQYFTPVKFDESHQQRNNNILDEVEALIKSGGEVAKSGVSPGVYKNGERGEISMIQDIRDKLSDYSEGIVPLNEWSEYDVLLARENNMVFFTWATYA